MSCIIFRANRFIFEGVTNCICALSFSLLDDLHSSSLFVNRISLRQFGLAGGEGALSLWSNTFLHRSYWILFGIITKWKDHQQLRQPQVFSSMIYKVSIIFCILSNCHTKPSLLKPQFSRSDRLGAYLMTSIKTHLGINI